MMIGQRLRTGNSSQKSFSCRHYKSSNSRLKVEAMNMAAGAASGMSVTAWHALSAEDTVNRLKSNAQSGLDAAEAPRRFQQHGPNRLPSAATRGPLKRFL